MSAENASLSNERAALRGDQSEADARAWLAAARGVEKHPGSPQRPSRRSWRARKGTGSERWGFIAPVLGLVVLVGTPVALAAYERRLREDLNVPTPPVQTTVRAALVPERIPVTSAAR